MHRKAARVRVCSFVLCTLVPCEVDSLSRRMRPCDSVRFSSVLEVPEKLRHDGPGSTRSLGAGELGCCCFVTRAVNRSTDHGQPSPESEAPSATSLRTHARGGSLAKGQRDRRCTVLACSDSTRVAQTLLYRRSRSISQEAPIQSACHLGRLRPVLVMHCQRTRQRWV